MGQNGLKRFTGQNGRLESGSHHPKLKSVRSRKLRILTNIER